MSPIPAAISLFIPYSAEVCKNPICLFFCATFMTSMWRSTGALWDRAGQSTSITFLCAKKARAFCSMRARSMRNGIFSCKVLDARDVFTGACVHFDFFALFDKDGDLDLRSAFGDSRFQHTARGIAA